MNTRIRIGDHVTFANLSAYPSLHGCIGVIQARPDAGYQYYGVRFLTGPMAGKRMACRESELRKA